MRSLRLCLLLPLMVSSLCADVKFRGEWMPLYAGVSYNKGIYLSEDDQMVQVHVIQIDTTVDGVSFVGTPHFSVGGDDMQAGDRLIQLRSYNYEALKVSSFLKKNALQVAINGTGYASAANEPEGAFKYSARSSYWDGEYREGYESDDLSPGVYFVEFSGGGVDIIDQEGLEEVLKSEGSLRFAIGGFDPLEGAVGAEASNQQLVRDGKNNLDRELLEDDKKYARTAIGIDKSKRYVYLVVVEGAPNTGFLSPGKVSEGVLLYRFAAMLVDIGVWDAINLDGSGGSTMVVEDVLLDRGLVVNLPSDYNTTGERAVATHVGVRARALEGVEKAKSELNLERIRNNRYSLERYRDALRRGDFEDISLYEGELFWGGSQTAIVAGLVKSAQEEDILDLVEEYRDVLERGLIRDIDLVKVGEKGGGYTEGGLYRDKEGRIWFVKAAQLADREYMTSRLLLGIVKGDQATETQWVITESGEVLTASRWLPSFREQLDLKPEERKLLLGKTELEVAMNYLDLWDRHIGNMGFVERDGEYVAARVDYDHSLLQDYGTLRVGRDFASEMRASLREHLIEGREYENFLDSIQAALDLPDSYIEEVIYLGYLKAQMLGFRLYKNPSFRGLSREDVEETMKKKEIEGPIEYLSSVELLGLYKEMVRGLKDRKKYLAKMLSALEQVRDGNFEFSGNKELGDIYEFLVADPLIQSFFEYGDRGLVEYGMVVKRGEAALKHLKKNEFDSFKYLVEEGVDIKDMGNKLQASVIGHIIEDKDFEEGVQYLDVLKNSGSLRTLSSSYLGRHIYGGSVNIQYRKWLLDAGAEVDEGMVRHISWSFNGASGDVELSAFKLIAEQFDFSYRSDSLRYGVLYEMVRDLTYSKFLDKFSVNALGSYLIETLSVWNGYSDEERVLWVEAAIRMGMVEFGSEIAGGMSDNARKVFFDERIFESERWKGRFNLFLTDLLKRNEALFAWFESEGYLERLLDERIKLGGHYYSQDYLMKRINLLLDLGVSISGEYANMGLDLYLLKNADLYEKVKAAGYRLFKEEMSPNGKRALNDLYSRHVVDFLESEVVNLEDLALIREMQDAGASYSGGLAELWNKIDGDEELSLEKLGLLSDIGMGLRTYVHVSGYRYYEIYERVDDGETLLFVFYMNMMSEDSKRRDQAKEGLRYLVEQKGWDLSQHFEFRLVRIDYGDGERFEEAWRYLLSLGLDVGYLDGRAPLLHYLIKFSDNQSAVYKFFEKEGVDMRVQDEDGDDIESSIRKNLKSSIERGTISESEAREEFREIFGREL